MAPIQPGDTIPSGEFPIVPYTPELDDPEVCGLPGKVKTDEWKGKKVLLVGVPGAFTPTCHVNHIPNYIKRHEEFKGKGVDIIAVIATNDLFVLSAWGRTYGAKDKVIFLSDPDAKWLASAGLSIDLSSKAFGVRSTRFAALINDLKLEWVDIEDNPSAVDSSSAEHALSHL